MAELPDLAILSDRMNRFHSRLLMMVKRRMDPSLRRRIAAEEILQEAFIKAVDKWQKSKQSAPIASYTWWYGLVRDCYIDAYRAQTRVKRALGNEVALPSRSSVLLCEGMLNSANRPSRTVAMRELLTLAIEGLNEDERELLWMRQYDQLSHYEIGEVLSCSHTAATQRYGKVMSKLRRTLDALDG